MKLTQRLLPLLLIVFCVTNATPALPHASLVRSSPPANAALKTAPRDVSILFSERVRAAPDAVAVRDAKGSRVDQGDARMEGNGRVVRTSLQPLAAGTYRVNWRVQSADSHTVQGSFTFHVRP